MNKAIYISLIFLFISFDCQSQNNLWLFSPDIKIDFSSVDPIVKLDSTIRIPISESNFTLSDSLGNIIFYTNGENIYNRDFQLMPNGRNIGGDASSFQGILCVHNSNKPNIYHLFVTLTKLHHIIIDLNADNGKGDVIYKNEIWSSSTEHITGIAHPCKDGVWIIVHNKKNNNEILAFLFHDDVIESPIISAIGTSFTNQNRTYAGVLRISPNGRIIALTNLHDLLEFYSFDPVTGIISNPVNFSPQLDNISYSNYYCGDFSENSQFFYTLKNNEQSDSIEIYQLSLKQFSFGIIEELKIGSIKRYNPFTNGNNKFSINRGPNNRIYISREFESMFPTILNPNLPGKDARFSLLSNIILKEVNPFDLSYISVRNITFNPIIIFEEINDFIFNLPDTTICQGKQLVLDLQSLPGTIIWEDDTTNKIRTFVNSDKYSVVYNDPNGCTYPDTFSLSVISDEIISLDTILCPGKSLVTSSHVYSSPGMYMDTSYQNDCPIITEIFLDIDSSALPSDTLFTTIPSGQSFTWYDQDYSDPGLYTYSYQNDNNCEVTDYLYLFIEESVAGQLYFPNIISANDDGINDRFFIRSEDQDLISVASFHIYNRWGSVVHRQEGNIPLTDISWNGKSGNDVLPTGVYTYLIRLEADENRKEEVITGTITLIR